MNKSFNIDPFELKLMIAKSGKSASELSTEMHYGANYLANSINRKKITYDAAYELKKTYNFNPHKYIVDDDIEDWFGKGKKLSKKPSSKDNDSDDFYFLLKNINHAINIYLNSIENKKGR